MLSRLLLIYFFTACMQAQVPTGGTSLLGPYPISTFRLQQNSGQGSMEKVPVTHALFNEAIQLTTTQAPANPWDIQASAYNKQPVSEGDVILLAFYGKMISTKDETGQASVGCVFEKASADYDKSLARTLNFTSEWQAYYLPFVVQQSFGLAEAQMNFLIGTSKAQVIQIANIQLINYKNKVALSSLPKTNFTYIGREPDAPWRKVAEENINRYRKADLELSIKSKKGKPVSEYTIQVKMTRHAFGWGTAIDAQKYLTDETYKKVFLQNFNKAVFENDMKWPEWLNETRRQTLFIALDSLRNQNIDVRGHCLVWPGWRWLPGYLRSYEKNPEQLKSEISKHIQDEGSAVGNKVSEWDVLNEPFTNTDITSIAGEQLWSDWFREAGKVCSEQKLYINDFSIFEGGGNDVAHQDHYYSTIKRIKSSGAPIHGIGFQSHFAASLTSPEKIWNILDRFKEFNLDMQVTEFDVDVDDEQLQADYTRDFMTAMFAYPSMKGFMTWGYWQSAHWKPQAAMYRSDWSIKPNGKIWQELIYKTWWSTFEHTCAETMKDRLFKGEYRYYIKDKSGKVVTSGTFTLENNRQVQIDF